MTGVAIGMLAGTISMIPTSDGRVDFVCAEGAREKLQARLNDQIDKEFNQKEATLKEQFAQLETDKTNAISSSYSWFQ